MSNPQWPHGLQPTRLLHTWDSPGKSTGVGCQRFLTFPVLQEKEIWVRKKVGEEQADASCPPSSRDYVWQELDSLDEPRESESEGALCNGLQGKPEKGQASTISPTSEQRRRAVGFLSSKHQQQLPPPNARVVEEATTRRQWGPDKDAGSGEAWWSGTRHDATVIGMRCDQGQGRQSTARQMPNGR